MCLTCSSAVEVTLMLAVIIAVINTCGAWHWHFVCLSCKWRRQATAVNGNSSTIFTCHVCGSGLIPISRQSGDTGHKCSGWLPLLSARSAVIFQAIWHHCQYQAILLMTEAYRCEFLAQSYCTFLHGRESSPQSLDNMSSALPIASSDLPSTIGSTEISVHSGCTIRLVWAKPASK